MTSRPDGFSRGDWIVHLHYGVGQIKGVEKKKIAGEETKFYKVKARNSTFWVPVDSPDATRIRPVASKYKIGRALGVLKRPPKPMNEDHMERKRRIKDVQGEGSLLSVARLVRDLTARQDEYGLNPTEERALETLSERFIREWSAAKEIEVEEVRSQFYSMLQNGREKLASS